MGGQTTKETAGEPPARQNRARQLFESAGRPRWLVASGAATVLLYLAMVPTFHTMANDGASLASFEFAGSVTRSSAIVSEWGSAGRDAARLQLLIDLPFMASYALFLAGACMFVARLARPQGRSRLERFATAMAWCGPFAAASDLTQNIALALVLGGHHTQPWPRISAVAGTVTLTLAAAAIMFAIGGTAFTLLAGTPQGTDG